jgi:hypothetical protein
MLRNYRSDSVVSFLLERCSLTASQLDTVMISRGGGMLKEQINLRDAKRKITKGAFLRTLGQGQDNIRGALYTLLLLEYLGLIDSRELFALGRIGDLMSKVKESSPSPESIRKLLLAIEEFAEKFSRRRTE